MHKGRGSGGRREEVKALMVDHTTWHPSLPTHSAAGHAMGAECQ